MAGSDTVPSMVTEEGKVHRDSGMSVSSTMAFFFGQMTLVWLDISDEHCEEQMGSLMYPLQLSLVSG